MLPKEEVFQNAKEIKLGLVEPSIEFKVLAEKIKAKWNSNLINGDIYNYVQMSSPIRLRLIFDSIEDIKLLPKFWIDRQETIGKNFIEILTENKSNKYQHFNLSEMMIDYFDFEELVFKECFLKVDFMEINQEFEQENIASIRKYWDYIHVFYQTDEDVKIKETMGVSKKIKDKIQEIAERNDLFGILKNRPLKIIFDSKDNIEKVALYNSYKGII
ncbi:MAG: hypothetical protein R2825_15875 [Saprospiraceae bacterium]